VGREDKLRTMQMTPLRVRKMLPPLPKHPRRLPLRKRKKLLLRRRRKLLLRKRRKLLLSLQRMPQPKIRRKLLQSRTRKKLPRRMMPLRKKILLPQSRYSM